MSASAELPRTAAVARGTAAPSEPDDVALVDDGFRDVRCDGAGIGAATIGTRGRVQAASMSAAANIESRGRDAELTVIL